MRYVSSDGLLSSADPKAVALWESIKNAQEDAKSDWTSRLRAAGIKLAHPDDGWVDRERGVFSLSWYAQFDDHPEVGDLIAFGRPPSGEHYVARADVWTGRRDAYAREQRAYYLGRSESAESGYRICRITKVERRHSILGYLQRFAYEDTGMRVPPCTPHRRWWKRRPRR